MVSMVIMILQDQGKVQVHTFSVQVRYDWRDTTSRYHPCYFTTHYRLIIPYEVRYIMGKVGRNEVCIVISIN